jgi:hypothetical protein
MDKVLHISGQDVGFRATALTPRFYRHFFGRDIIADMTALNKAYKKALGSMGEGASEEDKQEAQLSATDLELFENVAYIMARQYDQGISNTADEWLDNFDAFSIYEILPHILELWNINNATTAKPKKK